jgi:formylglycine-generating enzyme required for sulfatase activity
VWEWCADWSAPYTAEDRIDPFQEDRHSAEHRVLRGGSWSDTADYARSAARFAIPPGSRGSGLMGFRVAFRLN